MSKQSRLGVLVLLVIVTVSTVFTFQIAPIRDALFDPIGGNELVYDISAAGEREAQRVAAIIDRRLDALELSGLRVDPRSAGRVLVRFAGDETVVERVRRVIERLGELSLHLVCELSGEEELSEEPSAGASPRLRRLPLRGLGSQDPDSTVLVELGTGVALEDLGIAVAHAAADTFGLPAIGVELHETGARELAELTEADIGRRLAIVVDGEALCAPRISCGVGSRAIISGKFTAAEAQELAATLNGGSLPVVPHLESIGLSGPR